MTTTVQCPHCSQMFKTQDVTATEVQVGSGLTSRFTSGYYADFNVEGMMCRYCNTKTFSYMHIEECRAKTEARERVSLQDRIEDLKAIHTSLDAPDWDGKLNPSIPIKSAIEVIKNSRIRVLTVAEYDDVLANLRKALEWL